MFSIRFCNNIYQNQIIYILFEKINGYIQDVNYSSIQLNLKTKLKSFDSSDSGFNWQVFTRFHIKRVNLYYIIPNYSIL